MFWRLGSVCGSRSPCVSRSGIGQQCSSCGSTSLHRSSFVPIFVRFGLYRAIFRYTGLATMQTLLKAAVVYGVILLALVLVTFPAGVPRSVGVLQPILFLVLVSNFASMGTLLAESWRAARFAPSTC